MTFLTKLRHAQEKNNSWLCIGLDPQPDQLPLPALHQWDEPVFPFCKAIIEATADIACAFKPNLGFFLQWGAAGMIALERTMAYVPDDIPIILDCKAGDIGHTQAAWATGIFREWRADAFTVNPYVGQEAVFSALAGWPDKAVYVLARTSNPSGPQFQGDLTGAQTNTLAEQVIRQAAQWQTQTEGTVGLVVGATYPTELARARALAPTLPFLIPGIGAQGGDLATAVAHGSDPIAGPLISASRAVIYAGRGYDFADHARSAASQLRDKINMVRAG
jgi:orotidine-5'-phosphate decarboxylase